MEEAASLAVRAVLVELPAPGLDVGDRREGRAAGLRHHLPAHVGALLEDLAAQEVVSRVERRTERDRRNEGELEFGPGHQRPRLLMRKAARMAAMGPGGGLPDPSRDGRDRKGADSG